MARRPAPASTPTAAAPADAAAALLDTTIDRVRSHPDFEDDCGYAVRACVDDAINTATYEECLAVFTAYGDRDLRGLDIDVDALDLAGGWRALIKQLALHVLQGEVTRRLAK